MKRTLKLGIGAVLSLAMAAPMADACSRAVYFGEEGQTVTGRTMDWFVSDMDTNMWLYPRGLERTATPRPRWSGPRSTAASSPRSTKVPPPTA
jgi:penicillin V acylase-like amidase (Ntn superfamily)